MRIERLDLTAFGPFTERTLDLSAPGVHVVHGPNEAGKSTALHALGQLLYGIDQQSPYDFVHPKPALRLGARLRGGNGTTLEIVRTKGRKAPLQRPDGAPLSEADLLAMLGGIDRHTFATVFALNSAELRQGGRALVTGKGDLGQALSASRSGLSLTNALRDIEMRIGELFKRSASKPRINAQIALLKDARERKRSTLLRPERYDTLEQEVAAAQGRFDRLTSEWTEALSTHSRLSRLQQALPALRKYRDLLARMATVSGEGIVAPVEVAERLPSLLKGLEDARERLAESGGRLDHLAKELDGLVVDDDLLAHADTIESLFRDRKAVQDTALRLSRSSEESKRLAEEAERLLQQVHPDATLGDTAHYRVPKAVRSRLQALHDQRTAIATSLDQSRQALETRRRKLEEAEKALSELPQAEDPEPLRASVAAVPQDLLTRLATADEDYTRHRGRAEQILHDLKLTTLTVEKAGSVMAPSRGQVDAHIVARDEHRRDRRELSKKIKTCERELAHRRLDLEALLRDDPPPTEDELAATRTMRDALWQAVRGGAPGRDATVAEFEQAMSRADRMADHMRRDAQKANDRRRLELDIEKCELELSGLIEDGKILDARAVELDAEWSTLWEEFTGPAPKPDGAAAVLDDARRLRDVLDELKEAKGRLETCRSRAAQHVARLREILRDPEDALPGTGPEKELAELPDLLEIAQQRLGEQQKVIQERAAQEERVAVERSELAEARALLIQHERDLTGWQDEWRLALVQAGLPADRDTVGALSDLELLEQVAAKATEATWTDRESEEAAVRVEQFHALLRTTAATCGRTVPEDEAERYLLVDRLHADAKLHRAAAATRESLLSERGRLRTDADSMRAAAERAENELAELLTQTEVADPEELRAAARRRDEHTRLAKSLEDVHDTIAMSGEPLKDLLAKAEETDPDQLEAELTKLAERIDDLDTRRGEQSTVLGERKAELARLDGSALAAQAAAEVETSAAVLVEDTEEYLRLEIARAILRRHMEEFRDAQQDPVLAHAGRLFTQLTLGRFAGLELDQDGDSPTVLARSATRGLLRVDQLSEATADQLYLALRLATLERYAEEDRALPFAVDDIFMTFDDRRAQAALAVLDEMAERFQVIVFTHHDHLVELAHGATSPERIHVHPLPEFDGAK
ncbi:AAA family ATPase [Microbispora bryophytorum]|uniref:AAA family ATPase n=1 Tax=Microbispora bryophytorum TaxID=1460882 RepID=UPI0034050CE0